MSAFGLLVVERISAKNPNRGSVTRDVIGVVIVVSDWHDLLCHVLPNAFFIAQKREIVLFRRVFEGDQNSSVMTKQRDVERTLRAVALHMKVVVFEIDNIDRRRALTYLEKLFGQKHEIVENSFGRTRSGKTRQRARQKKQEDCEESCPFDVHVDVRVSAERFRVLESGKETVLREKRLHYDLICAGEQCDALRPSRFFTCSASRIIDL